MDEQQLTPRDLVGRGPLAPFDANLAPESSYASLSRRIFQRKARTAVIGMGYVGTQVAHALVTAGYPVLGLDVDPARLTLGREARDLASQMANGSFALTNDANRLAEADVITICVGTPIDRHEEPDLSALSRAATAVAHALRPGQLVILESTVYPGATEELLRGILDGSGLVCGEDYFLAYAPERVDPGNEAYRFKNTPKLVGGVTPEATSLAAAFYGACVDDVVEVSSPRVAEMAKLYENTYRAVNISFTNEIMLLCHEMGIDVWEMLAAAGTKPFGLQIFRPGPGIGGHCIPVDPFYLSWKAREYGFHLGFIEEVSRLNWQVAHHVVDRAARLLSDVGKALRGACILTLGVAYKADTADIRESPALRILPELERRGATILYHDPYLPAMALPSHVIESTTLTPTILGEADLTLVLTDHHSVDYEAVVRHAHLIYDTRGVTRPYLPSPNVVLL